MIEPRFYDLKKQKNSIEGEKRARQKASWGGLRGSWGMTEGEACLEKEKRGNFSSLITGKGGASLIDQGETKARRTKRF